ncbi:SLC13 family permease [Peptoniphilus mikwangii]|uniref:SLC13 family permease n=1 Tax=Peptoniphilus mikwangii TaxID=1354300 RepID=UPI00040CE305|nr:SLC13 family permease [Peptoniphilus mikwangii]
MKKIKFYHLLAILAATILIGILNPFDMEIFQRILLSALIFTVATWAIEAMNKSIACIILLTTFIFFGKTKAVDVINFAWSPTLFLIVTSTLLSVGIMKTGIIHKHFEKLFRKSSSSMFKILLLPYIFGIVLVFLIPQAFARVIIIGAIYNSLLKESSEDEKKAKQALIFNGFIGITMTYMLFSSGDIVLNQAAINFSGDEVKAVLTFGKWFEMMALPSIVSSVIVLFLTYIIFKKELSNFNEHMIEKSNFENNELSKSKQQLGIGIMLVVIAFWMTESMHHIAPWIVALLAVIIMFAAKILSKEDLKFVNPHFLLFLVTVFSIGKVFGQAGVTNAIFGKLETLIPSVNTSEYLIVIAIVAMVLHICIGSSVATMSVVLPILIPLAQSSGYRPEIITLMIYIIVNVHFLLPFHHATVMIGAGKGYYPDKYMFRFGSVMTVVSLILLALFYFPWWRILGVL